MCLILFAHEFHPIYRLVLAANRDEFYRRPTDPLARWSDDPRIVAGRDREGGGTWLGASTDARWAAVTNFREPATPRVGTPSRGHLVSDFLRSASTPTEYAEGIQPGAAEYNGFNLLIGDRAEVVWITNRAPDGEPSQLLLPAGIYGVSNHLLDTPWPKVRRGKVELARILSDSDPVRPEPLLHLLMDRTYAADHELPETGVDPALERALSSAFTFTPGYGTRSSSALLIDRAGRVTIAERSFDETGGQISEVCITV